MIANLADSLLVIKEQQKQIEDLRAASVSNPRSTDGLCGKRLINTPESRQEILLEMQKSNPAMRALFGPAHIEEVIDAINSIIKRTT